MNMYTDKNRIMVIMIPFQGCGRAVTYLATSPGDAEYNRVEKVPDVTARPQKEKKTSLVLVHLCFRFVLPAIIRATVVRLQCDCTHGLRVHIIAVMTDVKTTGRPSLKGPITSLVKK